jgi:hypothetical protein
MTLPLLWFAAILLLFFTNCSSLKAQTTIGPDTLLNQLTDLSTLPVLDSSVSSLQSSYDRTGGNADFGNFVSISNGIAVLADLKGPGAIVRMWSANPQGTTKIYIDDNPVPVLSAQFTSLFDNSSPPFVDPIAGRCSGGFYSYLPITYSKHCVVTTDAAGYYYQINFLSYPPDTAVRPFSIPLAASDSATLTNVLTLWSNTKIPVDLPGIGKTRAIRRLSTMPLGEYEGPGTITRICLSLPGVRDGELRNLILRGYFDGHTVADIEVPVADFFGSVFERHPFKSLLLKQSTDGGFEADFPMPYSHSAFFTLENGLSRDVRVGWHVEISPQKFTNSNEGYFHATWNRQMTVTGRPHVWLRVAGEKGKLVGIVQSMSGPVGLAFLEGDDQIRVDNQVFTPTPQNPTTEIAPWNGTGTEDCFNSGWYFSGGLISLPMNGVLTRADSGRIDCYRWFINDSPTFQSSIEAQIEHGGVNDSSGVDYSSVAYWYSDGPAEPSSVMPPAENISMPAPARPVVLLPNAIEGESLSGQTTGGSTSVQDMYVFGKVWSNNAQLFWHGGQINDSLSLTITTLAAGTYDLVGYFTRAPDYGQVAFQLNGQPIGMIFDGFAPQVTATGPIDLGQVTVPAGASAAKVTIIGKNTLATNTFFGLDALCFNPLGEKPVPLPNQ